MSDIVLSIRGSKLVKVCEAEGFVTVDDLIALSVADSVCPAICMTEGCDHIEPMECDQEDGLREVQPQHHGLCAHLGGTYLGGRDEHRKQRSHRAHPRLE